MTNSTPKLLQVCLSRSWGGLEMATFEFARDAAERGLVVHTICPPDSKLFDRLKSHGLPLTTLDAKKYFDRNAIQTIRNTIRKEKPSSVIMQQLRDIWHVSLALRSREFSSLPLYGFAHILLAHGKRDLFHRYLYKRVRSIVCLTQTQKENLLRHLPIKNSQLTIIPNGVDMNVFTSEKRNDEVRASLGAGSNDVLIGLIGRLDGMKGQLETVDAAALLRERGVRCKIAIIGEDTLNHGGTREKLEQKIKEKNLGEMVLLAGFRKDIPEIVASLDVLAMPSWAETFGRVLIEAMAAKTPVVATSSGGVVDIVVDHVDGLLVPPKDPLALALAFEKLVKDSSLREQLKTKAFEKVRSNYDLKLIQDKLDRLLLSSTL